MCHADNAPFDDFHHVETTAKFYRDSSQSSRPVVGPIMSMTGPCRGPTLHFHSPLPSRGASLLQKGGLGVHTWTFPVKCGEIPIRQPQTILTPLAYRISWHSNTKYVTNLHAKSMILKQTRYSLRRRWTVDRCYTFAEKMHFWTSFLSNNIWLHGDLELWPFDLEI